MPSPIGHALAGLTIAATAGRRAGLSPWGMVGLAIWATVPDVDIIVDELLGEPGRFHRGFTHSLLTTVVVSIFLAFILVRLRHLRFWPIFGLLAVTYGSHLILDMFVVGPRDPELGPIHPLGVPLFWPISRTRYDAGPLVFRPDSLVSIDLVIMAVTVSIYLMIWLQQRRRAAPP